MSSRPFEAMYEGTCNECSEDIEVVDMIAYNDYDELVHEDCL